MPSINSWVDVLQLAGLAAFVWFAADGFAYRMVLLTEWIKERRKKKEKQSCRGVSPNNKLIKAKGALTEILEDPIQED